MNEENIIAKIVEKSGKAKEEIDILIEQKKQELGNLVSREGAVAIVAGHFEVDIKNGKDEEVVIEDAPSTDTASQVEDMNLDDLGKKYIKSPKVGEEVEFVLKKIQKNRDIDATDKDGKKFKTNLTSVDYKIDYISSEDEAFSPKSWEVVGKVNGICKKLKKIEGIELKVSHIKDGMVNKDGDNYKVATKIDGAWKELDRKTQQWV